jgi:hypothetical protein
VYVGEIDDDSLSRAHVNQIHESISHWCACNSTPERRALIFHRDQDFVAILPLVEEFNEVHKNVRASPKTGGPPLEVGDQKN